jgi:hypothetical protein
MAAESNFPPSSDSAATASVHYRMPAVLTEVETLKAIAIIWGAALVVSLLRATVDIDLSSGIF